VTFHGRGGHGSAPHTAIDPVAIAARFIVDVQGVISREKDPTEFGVVTIGAIHGGTAGNIIPDSVQLSGTIRSYKPEVRAKLHAGIERTAKAAAAMSGAPAPDVKILEGTKPVINDPDVVTAVADVLKAALGDKFRDFAAGDRQRGFLRIRRRRRAVDDVQHRRLRPGTYRRRTQRRRANTVQSFTAVRAGAEADHRNRRHRHDARGAQRVRAEEPAEMRKRDRQSAEVREDGVRSHLSSREAASRRMSGTGGAAWFETALAPPHHEGQVAALAMVRKIAPLSRVLVQALPARLHCRPTSRVRARKIDVLAQMGGNNP
jgi:hypothetical protein